MNDLSHQLRDARVARKLSYVDAGKLVGVDRTTIANWEKRGVPRQGAARVAVQKFLEDSKALSATADAPIAVSTAEDDASSASCHVNDDASGLPVGASR